MNTMIQKQKSIRLVVVGHDDSVNTPDKDGFKQMRIFSKGKGTYKIDFNDDGKPCLWKIFDTKPFSMACMPYLDDKCYGALMNGKRVLVDEDIVEVEK